MNGFDLPPVTRDVPNIPSVYGGSVHRPPTTIIRESNADDQRASWADVVATAIQTAGAVFVARDRPEFYRPPTAGNTWGASASLPRSPSQPMNPTGRDNTLLYVGVGLAATALITALVLRA